MPTYEYLCRACDHEFEREQRITDNPVRTCPKCKKRKVERLISQTSFVLKGGGWYSDLYSSAKADKKSDGKDAGASDSGASGSDASDKPAKKDSKKSGSKKGGKSKKGPKAAA